MSSQGAIAAINSQKEIIFISNSGNIIKTVPIIKTALESIALDEKNGRVFVAGYNNTVVNNSIIT